MGTFKISQLEAALSAIIAELDAEPYQQGRTAACWTESTVAMSPANVAHSLGHLCYTVTVDSAPVSMSNGAPPSVKLQSDVVVRFCYKLRPTMQIADSRLASDAANDVCSGLSALSQYYSMRITNAFEPELSSDGEWMLVTVSFIATHTIPI